MIVPYGRYTAIVNQSVSWDEVIITIRIIRVKDSKVTGEDVGFIINLIDRFCPEWTTVGICSKIGEESTGTDG